MHRLLICLNKRELFDAKEKKCLAHLAKVVVSLIADGHMLTVLPLANIYVMKQDLEKEFLFEEELSTLIIKNSMHFFDLNGKFSNPLFYVPNAIKELNILSRHVIIVDKLDSRLEEANNYGYTTLKVPNLESPVYEKYLTKLQELANFLCKT